MMIVELLTASELLFYEVTMLHPSETMYRHDSMFKYTAKNNE